MAGCLGVFLALDLFLFFLFFEIVLVPMYFLIGGWGYGERRVRRHQVLPLHDVRLGLHAGRAIVSLAVLHAQDTGAITFDLQVLADEPGRRRTPRPGWLFLSFAIAFAVKVPLFPLHTWLPDAHTQAPTAGSVILAGVMLKLGTYGFLRFGLYLFPEASAWAAPRCWSPWA